MDTKELPARPNLEQYRKQAKDLIKLCASGDTDGVQRVKRYYPHPAKLSEANFSRASLQLADAQLTIAREHGFESWPKFTRHIDEITRANSLVSKFEAAADAVVSGDLAILEQLLRQDPELIRARSSRAHRATLLHYVAANGVEDYRQKTPGNAVAVAQMLLKAGAEVDATLEAYGAKATALSLVATSLHPARTGVQIVLLKTLLDAGAAVDGLPGERSPLIAALHNGRGEAAEFLAGRGARFDLEGAAGVGRLDVVKTFFNQDGSLKASATKIQMESGFLWACEYGRNSVIDFLLQSGADVRGQGNTGLGGLHWAIVGGQLETIQVLLKQGAPLEATNVYGGTALGQAIWSATNGDGTIDYVPILETLLRAGAKVDAVDYPTGYRRLDEVLLRYGAKASKAAAAQRTAGATAEFAGSLIQQALQARREKRLPDAQEDLLGAIEILRQRGSRSDMARALRELGEVERNLPDVDAAIQRYQEAVAVLRDSDEPLGLAHTIRHLGDVYHDAGEAALAEPCYQEALALYRSAEGLRALDVANAIRSLAVLKGEAGEMEEASKLWREAHDLYVTVEVPAGVAESAARLALLAWRQGDRATSREWLRAASAAAHASEDPNSMRYVGQVRAMMET